MNTFLFFDDFVFDHYRGVRRRHFKPQPCGDFYIPGMTAGSSVAHLPEEGLYRLYYNTIADRTRDWDRSLYYAESADGIHFEPVAELADIQRTSGVLVTRDDWTQKPEERFKSVIMRTDEADSSRARGYVVTSPDGVRWNTDTPYQVSEHASDTSNNVFYNPVLQKYQIICRGAHIDRRITSLLSADLIHWSDPLLVLSPTPFDPPLTQYYGMTVAPLDGILLGFLQLYYTDEDDPVPSKMAGKVDAALVYSYNGLAWNRVSDQPLVDRPVPPEFGSTTIYFSSMNPSPDGRDWILTAGGARSDHGCGFAPAYPHWPLPELCQQEGNARTLFYRVRKHGFAGMESYGYQARLRFRRMQLMGPHLTFNVCAPTGYVKFQLLGDDQQPIPGFRFEDSVPFTGDQVAVTPQWREQKLASLVGQRLFIELELQTAIVYSLEGDLRPHHGAQPEPALGIPWPAE
jgi:hypothetical protein